MVLELKAISFTPRSVSVIQHSYSRGDELIIKRRNAKERGTLVIIYSMLKLYETIRSKTPINQSFNQPFLQPRAMFTVWPFVRNYEGIVRLTNKTLYRH